MEINKNQALYKALPFCWITYGEGSNKNYKLVCEVTGWSTKPVTGINENMIKKDIKRRVAFFRGARGIAYHEFDEETINNFEFVEAVMNKGFTDIKCKVEPLTFYCNKCGNVISKYKYESNLTCPKCHISMLQLPFVYACECGHAEGVKPKKASVFYKGTDGRKSKEQYVFYDEHGAKLQMMLNCPECKKMLYPKNATDSKLFYSQSGNIVNLYNGKYEEALTKYADKAEDLMLAKWFGIVDNDKFNEYLNDQRNFFEGSNLTIDSLQIIEEAKKFNVTPEMILAIKYGDSRNNDTIYSIQKELNSIFPKSESGIDLPLIIQNLIEYDSLKYPKETIKLENAIEANKKLSNDIIEDDDINKYIDKLKIKNIQISNGVRIVNYAYGFTRLSPYPDESKSIRLRGFGNKVFTTVLDTEGILVEIDMLKVYRWLVDNEFIEDKEKMENELDAKKWFMKNIRLESINHFSNIPLEGDNVVTKAVYSLLHTISHMMIISAGEHSGLNKSALSEIISPETCSIYIYPTTVEGVTLGSLSGMFESDLKKFLDTALYGNEICTFDPICADTQNGACVACTYLSEVSCCHFNKDLSRSYLYGGKIKENKKELTIKKGFWK